MTETSNERLRRLLTLVPWLAAHSGVTKEEAARHFGLSVPQLESDLELVTVTGPGPYGGELVDICFDDETVTVYDAQGLLEPLQLSADESAMLLLGLRALQQLPDMDAGVIAGLIEKLGGAEEPVVVEVRANPFAAAIATAITDGHDLRIGYIHSVRDDRTERTVTPIELVTRDGIDYLHAWCHTAEAARTFRLDRMDACVDAGPSRPRSIAESVGPTHHRALLRVDTTSLHLLEGIAVELVAQSPESVTVALEYVDDAWLVGWLVSAGAGVTCTEPARIQPLVRARATAALAAYGRIE